jgi:DNA polymerase-3 subunit gamma/tau
MAQALYRKWRPHLWDQVEGQDHITHTLQNAIRAGRVGHAYLFAGPRGTGKTTTARLLAKAVNCLAEDVSKRPCDECAHCVAVNEGRFLDLIEIDAASNTSVDDIRDLRDKINFSPSQGSYKVYIIDEVHMLSTAAFNALLKTLEEPPKHAIFILATTEMHKIPATVLSRCQLHEFRRIPVPKISAYLKERCQQEGLQVDDDALTLIARQSTGAMRDAISLLDQLTSTGEHITLAAAQEVLGTATNTAVVNLVDAIINHQPAAGLDGIQTALDGGTDPRQFSRQVVEYLRSLMLVSLQSSDLVEATPELKSQMARHAQSLELGRLLAAIRLFNNAASEPRSGAQPGLLLELALVEASSSQELAAPVQRQVVEAVQTPRQAPVVEAAPRQESQPVAPPAQGVAPSSNTTASAAGAPEVKTEPQAETSQPQVASQPAAASSGTHAVTLGELQKKWPSIRAMVKKVRPSTEALLNSSKLISVSDGVLVMGFMGTVLKVKMEAEDNIELTRRAVYQAVGADLAITCIELGAKVSSSPAELGADSDGMVSAALNLGGQILKKD